LRLSLRDLGGADGLVHGGLDVAVPASAIKAGDFGAVVG
jgi:hypothetical protein